MPTPESGESDTGAATGLSPRERLLERWLDALLPQVADHGWTPTSLESAGDAAGLSRDEQAFAAPAGVDDLIEAFLTRGDRSMLAALSGADVSALKIRERVALGVMSWLDAFEDEKPAFRRAVARGVQPWNAGRAGARTWRLADAVWDGAGDTATDYNRYTKRGLLAAVLPTVTLYWLQSDSREATEAFLMRRLTGAMRFGQVAGSVIKPVLNTFSRKRGD